MTTVFIGGSRRVAIVDERIASRIRGIIEQGFDVLVGDAAGFDLAVQQLLSERQYARVTVYCTNGVCRHNVGNWPVFAVAHPTSRRDRSFYSAKDDAMIRGADYGLFAWDERSKGTQRNIRLMAELAKPSVVFLSRTGSTVEIRRSSDLDSLQANGVMPSSSDPGLLFGEDRRLAG